MGQGCLKDLCSLLGAVTIDYILYNYNVLLDEVMLHDPGTTAGRDSTNYQALKILLPQSHSPQMGPSNSIVLRFYVCSTELLLLLHAFVALSA